MLIFIFIFIPIISVRRIITCVSDITMSWQNSSNQRRPNRSKRWLPISFGFVLDKETKRSQISYSKIICSRFSTSAIESLLIEFIQENKSITTYREKNWCFDGYFSMPQARKMKKKKANAHKHILISFLANQGERWRWWCGKTRPRHEAKRVNN